MSMERSTDGFRALGDHDLAARQAEIQEEFARRHPDLLDIPLTGRLPGEISRLDPSLEGKVRTVELTIGGKTAQELLAEFDRKKINVGSYARSMVMSPDFATLPEPTQIEVVVTEARNLKPRTSHLTIEQIYKSAEEKGLDLLPAEVLPHYLLQHGDTVKINDWLVAGMKPIADSGGGPRMFNAARHSDGLWLYGRWAEPSDEWYPGDRFAFSLRK